MTKAFSLQDSSVRLNATGASIPYAQIESIEIFEGIKVSKKKFMLVYWIIWCGVVTALVGGSFIDFDNLDSTTMTSSALILGLGLLAQNPIYNMFPSGTFLRIWYQSKNIDLEISELTEDDRIHTLIRQLKAAVGDKKIKIVKR